MAPLSQARSSDACDCLLWDSVSFDRSPILFAIFCCCADGCGWQSRSLAHLACRRFRDLYVVLRAESQDSLIVKCQHEMPSEGRRTDEDHFISGML